VGFSEHGNVLSGSIKHTELLDRGGGHYFKNMLRNPCVLIMLLVIMQYICTK
jgi:hypothetical protein